MSVTPMTSGGDDEPRGIGIDFGTCSTRGALLWDGNPKPVRFNGMATSTPSCAFVDANGNLLVGAVAEFSRNLDPPSFIREFKREIAATFPYHLRGRKVWPHDLITEMLKSIRGRAEDQSPGVRFHPVVLTVPAKYTEHNMTVMRDAAQRAGFETSTITLVPEPEAAAFYYQAHRSSPTAPATGELLLVYDLGGGTFDASLLKQTDGQFKPVAPPVGKERLGGVDFDMEIHRWVDAHASPRLRELLAAGDADDPARRLEGSRLRLWTLDECRRAKEHLSDAMEAPIVFMSVGEEIVLRRADLERMIEPYLAETVAQCRALLKNANKQPSDVTSILLVGGSCRIPFVKTFVERELGRPAILVDDPELAVCYGATLFSVKFAPQSLRMNRAAAYRLAVETAWSDRSLDRREVEYLSATSRDLGLDAETALEVEVGVLGSSKEGILNAEAGRTLEVGTERPGAFQTISEAIQNANPGDTITIAPGEYGATLFIDKPLRIESGGAAGTVVIKTRGASCVKIAAQAGDEVHLTGLTLRATGAAVSSVVGAVRVDGGHVIITGCDITSKHGSGITVAGSGSRAEVGDCFIHDVGQFGVYFDSEAAGTVENVRIQSAGVSGIEIAGSRSVIVRNTQVHGGALGIHVHSNAAPVIEGCDIFENKDSSIQVIEAHPRIHRCRIRDGGDAGLVFHALASGVVDECVISGHALAGIQIGKRAHASILQCELEAGKSVGVLVVEDGSGFFAGCSVLRNGSSGIEVRERGRVTLRGCRVSQNASAGIRIADGTADVEGCDLIGNEGGSFEQLLGASLTEKGNETDVIAQAPPPPPPSRPNPPNPPNPPKSPTPPRETVLRTLFRESKTALGRDFYVAPSIPDRKLRNARARCAIASEVKILAVYDNTVFGSAKDCIVFTGDAVHTCLGGMRWALRYSQFRQQTFTADGMNVTTSIPGKSFLVLGSVNTAAAVRLLDAIRALS